MLCSAGTNGTALVQSGLRLATMIGCRSHVTVTKQTEIRLVKHAEIQMNSSCAGSRSSQWPVCLPVCNDWKIDLPSTINDEKGKRKKTRSVKLV